MPPSPFQHVLYTNYAPSDAEAEQITALCIEPEAQLIEIDMEIKRLEAQLAETYARRKVVTDFVDSHRALLSPIRRLSPEMLQNIFTFCLPDDRNCMMSVSEGPLLLGGVCKLWRDTAYSSPNLWSSVHVVVPSTENVDQTQSVLTAFREWLCLRSGACPLHISMFGQSPFDHDAIKAFLSVILPLMAQWADISLNIPLSCFEDIEADLRASSSQDLSMLRSFVFNDCGMGFGHGRVSNLTPNPFQFLEKSTKLSRTSFTFTTARRFKGILPPAVPCLTELDLDYAPSPNDLILHEFLGFLKSCQHLQGVRVLGRMINDESPRALVILPKLERLVIHVVVIHQPDSLESALTGPLPLIDQLVTPALKHLEMPIARFLPFLINFNLLIPSISNLIHRSNCSLTKLLFGAPTDGPLAPLAPLLRDLDNLTELCINCQQRGFPFHTALQPEEDDFWSTLTSGSTNFCPNLQVLTVWDADDKNLYLLLAFVKSRVYLHTEAANNANGDSDSGRLRTLNIRVNSVFMFGSPSVPGIPREFRASIMELQCNVPGFTAVLPAENRPPPSRPWLGLPGQEVQPDIYNIDSL